MLTKSTIICSILLVLSSIMLAATLYLIRIFLNQTFEECNVVEFQEDMDIIREIGSKRRWLTMLLIALMPLFPLVYTLSALKLLDQDGSLIGFSICNLSTKVLYVVILLNSHTNTANFFQTSVANAARRAFLRFVMHEVRGPLNSVSSGIGVLKSARQTEDISDTLLMMDAATIFMAETLNNILSMQKIEEGKLELVMEPFIVSELVQSVSKALYGILKEKRINLRSCISVDIPQYVIGDGYRIEHALANLLSNAAKFTPVGGEILIAVSAAKIATNVSCQLHFSVTDSGPGMTEAQISLLFRPFTQLNAHELQRGGGTGVGLSICKRIAELHGGTVGARSKIGEGSTFYFTVACLLRPNISPDETSTVRNARKSVKDSCFLSLEDGDHYRRASHVARLSNIHPQAGLRSSKPQIAFTRRRVLVVDGNTIFIFFLDFINYVFLLDVFSNRKLLCRLLHQRGFETAQAKDGQEALQMIDYFPFPYDIIFMDNTMPNMVHEISLKLHIIIEIFSN